MALNASSTAPAALDALEASLKTVLLQTGSALSNAVGADGTKLLHVRSKVEAAMPDNLKRWHSALNDLEAQLNDAKAALHRDLAALRSRNLVQSTNVSPESLDSDTVMVEAPLEPNDVPAQQTEESLTAPDERAESIKAPAPTESTEPSAEQPAAQIVPDKHQAQAPQPSHDKPSPSNGLNLELLSTPQNNNSPSASPLPSIERLVAPASNLEDPGNELANTDISDMLPALVDYANDSMDDLFGDADAAGGPNDTSGEDLFGTSAVGDNPFGADAGIDFGNNFSFEDLAMQGATGETDDGESATFDHSFFTEDFFNLDGDVEGGGGNA